MARQLFVAKHRFYHFPLYRYTVNNVFRILGYISGMISRLKTGDSDEEQKPMASGLSQIFDHYESQIESCW